MSKIEKIANFIVNEHIENNIYKNLPDALKPQNIEEAYLAQNAFHKTVGRGELGGYKIALASKNESTSACALNSFPAPRAMVEPPGSGPGAAVTGCASRAALATVRKIFLSYASANA